MAKKPRRDDWISDAVNPAKKGDLHKRLGVPQGKKIPEAKLSRALKSPNPTTKHEAQFAKNVRKRKAS